MNENTILIWGAGAIGGTLGAYLVRAGEDVLLVDIVEPHVDAMKRDGLFIEGPVETFQQKVQAALPSEVTGQFNRIIVAVKAHHTRDAVRALKPHLAENGTILSAQNGLNELIIAEEVGAERTIGCFVNFGAEYTVDTGVAPLARLGSRVDGLVAGALVGTNLHGPFLPMNPSWADHLLDLAAARAGVTLGEPAEALVVADDYARRARAAIRSRL